MSGSCVQGRGPRSRGGMIGTVSIDGSSRPETRKSPGIAGRQCIRRHWGLDRITNLNAALATRHCPRAC